MRPNDSAKNVTGNSDNFTSFTRRLLHVPHSEIKSGTARGATLPA